MLHLAILATNLFAIYSSSVILWLSFHVLLSYNKCRALSIVTSYGVDNTQGVCVISDVYGFYN